MLALIPVRKNGSLLNVSSIFDLADEFFNEASPFFGNERKALSVEFDIVETDENIVVKADLPGIDTKDLDIEVHDRVLTLKGSRKEEHTEKDEHRHRTERRFGSFCRSLRLPDDVEVDKIEAGYKDGVLRVTIPKGESARPKKIEVH
jgi:HSP20 family protein